MEFISNISVLKKRPGSETAMDIITRAARFVQPIMKKHGFKVGLLCEMFPKKQELQGLNINHGQKVCLRLREHHDDRMFLPMTSIMGTLLHELCHNKHGPHNAHFYAYLKELEDDYYALVARGFSPDTPHGHLGRGQTLGAGGGRTLGGPPRGIAGIPGLGARPGRGANPANAVAPPSKIAKPTRKKRFEGSGNVLGSSTPSPPPLPGRRKPRAPTREQILAAVEKRLADTKWCASENAEISKEVDENDDEVVFLGEKKVSREGVQEEPIVEVKTEPKKEPKVGVKIPTRAEAKSEPEVEIMKEAKLGVKREAKTEIKDPKVKKQTKIEVIDLT